MRLHLTCILLIAVISMRGDASEIGVSDATTAVPKNETDTAASIPPEPTVPTPKPEPSSSEVPSNVTTVAPTTTTANTTTVAPSTTPVSTEPSSPTTTVAPASTTAVPNATNTTTVAPTSTTSTTVKPQSSTVLPVTTERPDASTPSPSEHRHFDGLSFMGGIILACCLVIIGAFTWKFYKDRKDGNYRIL